MAEDSIGPARAPPRNTGIAISRPASFLDRYDHGFSPRIGLLVQPLPWLSLYGNFTQSLGANNGTTASNTVVLPPQKGQQWEAGVKAEFFDKRLSASIAYYDITKTNVTEPDPTNPNNVLACRQGPQPRSSNSTSPDASNANWSVIANYSHDDVRVVQGVETPNYRDGDHDRAGHRRQCDAGSPRNYGNLWVKYEADGAFKGLSVAGGVAAVAVLRRQCEFLCAAVLRLLNGMIAYRSNQRLHVTAQLNAKNLTDTRYFSSSTNRTIIMPGTPQTFLGSPRWILTSIPTHLAVGMSRPPLSNSHRKGETCAPLNRSDWLATPRRVRSRPRHRAPKHNPSPSPSRSPTTASKSAAARPCPVWPGTCRSQVA